jgi:pimeloyl-ACP methyl ester carboxylesterase
MGGNVIVNLANLHQRLLTTIIAIEPILNKSAFRMSMSGVYPLTYRKDTWTSRATAVGAFCSGLAYRNFHPDVVELFGEYGLRKNIDGTVSLVTAKTQELSAYARAAYPSRDQALNTFTPTRSFHWDLGLESGTGRERNPEEPFYRPEALLAWAWLPFLKQSVLFLHGDRSHMIGSSAKGRAECAEATGWATGGSGGARDGRVKDVTVPGSHFVPMENPEGIASVAAKWLDVGYLRWAGEGEAERATWHAMPVGQRTRLTDDWKFWAKDAYSGKQSRSATKL